MRRFFGELLRHGNVNSRTLSQSQMFRAKMSYPSANQLAGLQQDIELYKLIKEPSALDCKKLLDQMHETDLCDYHVNFSLYLCLDELNGLLWNKFNYKSAEYDSVVAMRESVKTFRFLLRATQRFI